MKEHHVEIVKKWCRGAYRSLTIRFNSIAWLIYYSMPDIERNLPSMSAYLTPELYKWFTFAVIMGNVLIRAKTNQSLIDRGENK